ncbi:esterase/lipase family protein [Kitasatospora sp. NBC_01560]|uniref:esterase/lipase family protein n=1 Tax=Kitasatospora sp. NBC_01560 TaxID=2975965 RepID=UPI00386CED1C
MPEAATTPRAATAPRLATTPNPVIFVHGRNADPGVWSAMIDSFEAAGHPADRLFAWSYDSTQSTNEVLAARLADYVDGVLRSTGAAQVDFVAHSLGSLPARWYVRFGGGAAKVAHLVSLAGPNHGTTVGWLCALWDQGCRDMTPGSYVLSHLNSGTEAPPPVRYTTFWSSCDEQIAPPASTTLAGAVNIRTACLKHNDLLTDPAVASGVRAALAA